MHGTMTFHTDPDSIYVYKQFCMHAVCIPATDEARLG